MKAPALEVADVMRTYGGQYFQVHGGRMPAIHRKAIGDITACRTPAMGGATYHCPDCDHYQYSYHSCGNRSCNKCGNERAQDWLIKAGSLLLAVDHFMVTFTLPGELRRMARSHQRLFYGLLMSCAAASLQTLGWDSRFVGGQLAMMGVLHTWGRDLSYHPHVHMIVAGGGLWKDEELWLASRSDFLVPVKALSVIFAAKFRDGLKKQAPELFGEIDPSLWGGSWVVHSQSVGKGQAALKYLATYIFRPAISNGRLLSMDNGTVTFRYQQSQTKQWKVCCLRAEEFIRRYLQHVLPRGFVKVRYYGLYGHRHRERLNRLRETLDRAAADTITPSIDQVDAPPPESPPATPSTCRSCGRTMFVVGTIPRFRPAAGWPNAPPDHGRSTRQYQSKQTTNAL
jgi:Putative transposase.